MAKSKGSFPEGFCSRNMQRLCHTLTFLSGTKTQLKLINSSKSPSCYLLTTSTYGNTSFYKQKINPCGILLKYTNMNPILEISNERQRQGEFSITARERPGAEPRNSDRWSGGSTTGCSQPPQQPVEEQLPPYRAVSDPFWMSCC